MKGLELAKRYFEEFGKPMLLKDFPHLIDKVAIGLVGSGSECYGFDDKISTDHDFEPAFCIFASDDLDRQTLFNLERAYLKLPKEFLGFKRNDLSPVGGKRHGVILLGDFLEARISNRQGKLDIMDWFFLPEQSLFELTSGELFLDNWGVFSKIRSELKEMPQDVKLKKLAGNLLVMGQAGQYNYLRCIKRNDTAAAQLSVIEFVKAALNVIFLLNSAYVPYYKWVFRSLLNLEKLGELSPVLENLISSDNNNPQEKSHLIEKVYKEIINELKVQGITDFLGDQLEGHAYSVNNKIVNSHIRNLHVLYAV